jgi:hypothetical protein
MRFRGYLGQWVVKRGFGWGSTPFFFKYDVYFNSEISTSFEECVKKSRSCHWAEMIQHHNMETTGK